MKFKCGSSNYRLTNSQEKNRITSSLKNSHKKNWKKNIEMTKKNNMLPTCDNIQSFFNNSSYQTFRQNLNAFLLKKGFEFTKYLYNVFLLIK